MEGFREIEKKWQEIWEKEGVFRADDNSKKPKFYVLEMFPYPSGTGLHMGHAWNYVIGDILARYKRMKGFNVLYPMGYDSLGLPAENAAISEGIHPKTYTEKSIKNYIQQQKNLGLSYDWSRLIITSEPSYYKWDQWIFLRMFERGLAYQKKSAVNWCDKCKTVLANEQVINGRCWRHEETKVTIKHLKQWFLKISVYADELYEDIDKLKGWPEKTRTMQKNWIGKSKGLEIDFRINGDIWPVFTTRPDTIYGVSFVVVSAQHEKLFSLVSEEQKDEVNNFLSKIKSVSEKDLIGMEKEGVFSGSYAVNPVNGEKVPVYIGNFVVADYGSGMVMAVPAHDKRDYEFAKKYKLKIIKVIEGGNGNGAYTGEGILINSGKFNGLESSIAREKISEYLIKKGLARRKTNFKLRDWLISRQRYWGTPIPIIYCSSCGVVPVRDEELPVELPENVKFGEGNPLETAKDWVYVSCPKCKGKAKRETDTMDTFVNSSWYFLRYCDPRNNDKIFNKDKVEKYCPIDVYIGGAEHATGHLIYFRFYTKFLSDLKLINFREPAKRLFHQGMLLGSDGRKMSKSRGNVVLPETISEKYGIDVARFFLSSVASPDKNFSWDEHGIMGSKKFILSVCNYFKNYSEGKESDKIRKYFNESVKELEKFYDSFEYRKASIRLRKLFSLIKKEKVSRELATGFLKILSPICPHISEELNERIGNRFLIAKSSWPRVSIEESDTEEKSLEEAAIENIERILGKINRKPKRIYVYVLPFESIDTEKLKRKFDAEVLVFKTSDRNIIDPYKKAKKAKKGMPGIYVE